MKYLIILALLVVAWCPWLSADEAKGLVDTAVAAKIAANPDLCAMTIHPETISKVPLGYTEKVSFNCAINDPIYGVTDATNIVFVTFYKDVWGIPRKTIAAQ